MNYGSEFKMNFFVIGAQKSGTTTIHDVLDGIPGVSLPKQKETHYYSNQYEKGIGWYKAQFKLKGELSNEVEVFGEVDPEYIFWPGTANRIYDEHPDAKIVCILRDPIFRAVSQYKMSVRRGIEDRSFETALAAEFELIDSASIECGYSPFSQEELFSHSYLLRSLYSKQIKEYLEKFPRENIYFMLFENLTDSDKYDLEIGSLLEFLGIKCKEFDLSYTKSNEAVSPKSYALNKMLWDKSRLNTLRKILRAVLPEVLRHKISQTLYSLNQNSDPQSKINVDVAKVDARILSYIKHDVNMVADMTKLDLSCWRVHR